MAENPQRNSSEEPSRDGGFSTYNALAFNTLLSSQETDTHHRGASAPPPGQPSNHTPQYPSCQPRFLKFSRMLRTRSSRRRLLGGSPGPVLPRGVQSPSGHVNSTTAGNLRQIGRSDRRRGTHGRYTDTDGS